MWLLNAFQNWQESRYKNHIEQMKKDNKCPDCGGRGFHFYPAYEFIFCPEQIDCSSCAGTGTYQNWVNKL